MCGFRLFFRKIENSMKKPAYYLAYDAEQHALVVYINSTLQKPLQDIFGDNNIIPKRLEQNPSYSYNPNLLETPGFNSCGIASEEKDFLKISFPIPKAQYTNEPCSECSGTGKYVHDDSRDCYFCKGEGREIFYGKTERDCICLTLNLLFQCLDFLMINNQIENFEQHAMLVTCVIGGRGGMGVGGYLSKEFTDALSRMYVELYAELEQKPVRNPAFVFDAQKSMVDIWVHMHIDCKAETITFDNRAILNLDGKFYIECLGENGCSLYTTSGPNLYFDEGSVMGDHNVDSAIQQLTLLVGFAKMYEEVIEFMNK